MHLLCTKRFIYGVVLLGRNLFSKSYMVMVEKTLRLGEPIRQVN